MIERITLKKKQLLELYPRAPFNFDATMHKPDHFLLRDNEWQPGTRWQTMLWNDIRLGLKLENQGTIEQPRLNISIWSNGELTQDLLENPTTEINYRYNLQADLTEFNRIFKDSSLLKPIIHKWRGMGPLNCSSLYEYLIITIVLQNATVRRSINMLQSLFESYGTLLSYDEKELFCF